MILTSSEEMKRTTKVSSPGLLLSTMVLAASTTCPIWLREAVGDGHLLAADELHLLRRAVLEDAEV
jgi:hypothetical protein